MNSNSEENKDHVELTEKSAQQWLKIRRYTPVPEGDVSEQGLKEVEGTGLPALEPMVMCRLGDPALAPSADRGRSGRSVRAGERQGKSHCA
jgi:hypothetical protein